MEELGAVRLAGAEKAHCLHVDERHVLQVQDGPGRVDADSDSQSLEMLRANSPTETKNRSAGVRLLLDSQCHLVGLTPDHCK